MQVAENENPVFDCVNKTIYIYIYMYSVPYFLFLAFVIIMELLPYALKTSGSNLTQIGSNRDPDPGQYATDANGSILTYKMVKIDTVWIIKFQEQYYAFFW